MHLSRICVPSFRVLKNVDIIFEKEFTPKIFPLGSQNGGGKSTLLQLIFVLLHCSVNPDRMSFLKNFLIGFEGQNTLKRRLALFEIEDGNNVYKINYFSYADSILSELLDERIDSRIGNINDFKFSSLPKLISIERRIEQLENGLKPLEEINERLIFLKEIEDSKVRDQNFKRLRHGSGERLY